MIKDEIITAVSRETGYSRHVTEKTIESLLANITKSLEEGQKIQFVGFGTFEPKERAARIGRNPRTKEPVQIPARVIPSFKPGKNLKDAVCK